MFSFYLACLIGGLVATLLFAALGMAHGASHGGHLTAHSTHAAHAALPHAHGEAGPGGTHPHQAASAGGRVFSLAGGTALSLLSPLSLAAAALFFGAGGLIADTLTAAHGGQIEIIGGLLAAALGIFLVRRIVLSFAQASTPELAGSAVGAIGVLSAPIRDDLDLLGEVTYTIEGNRSSSAARGVQRGNLPRGTVVLVERKEKGVAYVSALDPLDQILEGQNVPAAEARSDHSPPS